MSQLTSNNSGIKEIKDTMTDFLKGFRDRSGRYKYREYIGAMSAKQSKSIVIDYNDLILYNQDAIVRGLLEEPQLVLKESESAVYEVLRIHDSRYAESIRDGIRIRITNYPNEVKMRDIDATMIGRMITTTGMLVRASEVKPFVTEFYYKCSEGHEGYIARDERFKGNDILCPNCKEDATISVEKGRFSNLQVIRMQELPEDLPPGQLPYHIDVILMDDIVDIARPGDRIILTGIVGVEKDAEGKSMDIPLYRIRLTANNVEFLNERREDNKRGSRNGSKSIITEEDEKEIKRLANKENIYELLIDSFAPHIFGHGIIKEAILLQIVGSPAKVLEDGTKIRGDINILLVGDPGTAKSELLKYAARIAPRGLYTSGRGSTAAGLTAAVVRDKSGMMMLEAGAVVLGDQGLVCIDELDKMRQEDRSALHEVMEQQTCSVAKGGIVATLNARASILAAANPILGKYDPYRNITENINLPIPLLTRFDLIFAIRDEPNREGDAQLARHILGIHRRIGYERLPYVSIELLRKYLAYAKQFNPVLSKEAEDRIFEYYMQMRANASPDAITITARQLEALIRLATARARLLLKSNVDASDAERAIYIFNFMLNKVGIDVKTGKVDIGVLHGMPQSERSKMQLFLDVLNALAGKDQNPVEEQAFITELVKTGRFTEDDAREWIRKALSSGVIYEVRQGFYKRA
jgi:replicative DNA helicase Mcm